MKRAQVFTAIAAAFLSLSSATPSFAGASQDAQQLDQAFSRSTLQIATADAKLHKIDVWVADNDVRRMRGLMFVKDLADDAGMLFVYPQSQEVGIWMKNTPLPLDILFVNADGKSTFRCGHLERLPLATPYEALILASIVEKETGQASERPMIAAVFINRLRNGMKLQTDPTVIYGLGENFDGNLRKRDLLTDTAYNTYTRTGLPPTPISLPGVASLTAALNPAPTNALYFVSRGDGTSHFSGSLTEHERAVTRYQRRGNR